MLVWYQAEEHALIAEYMTQIITWVESGAIVAPTPTVLEGLDAVPRAHELLQSGKTVGKLVIKL